MLAEPSPRQLEQALERHRGGASISEATGITPAAAELEKLLLLTDELVALPALAPAAAVRVRVRNDFLEEGVRRRQNWIHYRSVKVRASRHPVPTSNGRWIFALLLGLVVAFVAGIALALAAQLAEPDSVLFPIKKTSERLLLAVTRDPVARASIETQLANQRYRDAEAMAAKNKSDLAVDQMRTYYDDLRAAGETLAAAPRRSASWNGARDQLDKVSSKPIDILLVELNSRRQVAAAQVIQALAAQFAADRKVMDQKLRTPTVTQTQVPQPGSSAVPGSQPVQPNATPAP